MSLPHVFGVVVAAVGKQDGAWQMGAQYGEGTCPPPPHQQRLELIIHAMSLPAVEQQQQETSEALWELRSSDDPF